MPRNWQFDRFSTPADLLGYEIIQEQASALGRLGRGLEAALAKLRAFDTAHPPTKATPTERQARRALVVEAGHALWMFMVQREACGMRDSHAVKRNYQVPQDVQEQVGVFPATRRAGVL